MDFQVLTRDTRHDRNKFEIEASFDHQIEALEFIADCLKEDRIKKILGQTEYCVKPCESN